MASIAWAREWMDGRKGITYGVIVDDDEEDETSKSRVV